MTARNNPAGKDEDMGVEKVLEFRVTSLEKVVSEVSSAVKSIDSSLKTLTSLEIHHNQTRDAVGRAFTNIEDHEGRLREIESDLPTMRLVRNWVIAGVLGCTSLVGVAVAGMVIISSKTQPAVYAQPVPRQTAESIQSDSGQGAPRGWR